MARNLLLEVHHILTIHFEQKNVHKMSELYFFQDVPSDASPEWRRLFELMVCTYPSHLFIPLE